MYICYVDESGCTGELPAPNSPIQPVFVIAGITVDATQLANLTGEYLSLKRRFFPGHAPASGLFLDWILPEIKGADLRRQAATGDRNARRHALGFIGKILKLCEGLGIRIFGRIWVKGIGQAFHGRAIYTSSIQRIVQDFQHFLESSEDCGILIADSRSKSKNAVVAHSIFTQRYKRSGPDPFHRQLEMPTFGHSENHAGLQISDLLCSALIFPMAVYSYCTGHVTNLHVRPGYAELKLRFGEALSRLQYRYHSDRWRGGLTVSDRLGGRSGSHLFR